MSSQKDMIREALEEGRILTALDALEEFNCFRLAARIHDLREDGVNIESMTLELPNGKSIAAYRLRPAVPSEWGMAA